MAAPTITPHAASDQELRRLEEIHRRWIRVQTRELWLERSDRDHNRGLDLLTTYYLGFLCILPDYALTWPATSTVTPSLVHHVDGLRLAATLILVSLLNGWLLDRFFAFRIPGEPPRPTARALRFLACSAVPLVLAVPGLVYRWLREYQARLERREWTPSNPAAGFLSAARDRFHVFREERGNHALVMQISLAWVLLSNLILPFAGMYWLTNPAEMTHGRRAAIVASSVLIHLVGFATSCYASADLRSQQTKWNRRLMTVLPVFWLVPLPFFSLLGMVLLFESGTKSRGDGTLTASAYDGRGSVGRLSTWRNLEAILTAGWPEVPLRRRLRPVGGLEKPMKPGIDQTRRFRFYKGKSIFLFFDAAVCFGLLGAWQGQLPVAVDLVATLALLVASPIAGTAFMVHLVVVTLRTTRSRSRWRTLDEHPYALYLGITQWIFFAGALTGYFLGGEFEDAIWMIFLVTGLVALLFYIAKEALPVPERIRQSSVEKFSWTLPFFGMFVIALDVFFRGSKVAQAWANRLEAVAQPGSVIGVLLSTWLVGWLLRPFTARQVFDKGLPLRKRLLLAVLTLTAVLPLGGLFVPLWIYVRHRVEPWRAETGAPK